MPDANIISPSHALTVANLLHFCPELLPRSEEIFQSVTHSRKRFKEEFILADLDLPVEKRGCMDFEDLLESGPVIFVSFHMGPVGPLLACLSNYEVDFKLLQDRLHYERGAKQYDEIYHAYTSEHGLNHRFSTLNIEEEGAGRKIVQTLRTGESLLLYIDGNTGAGGMNRQDSKLCTVDFMGKRIYARKSIAAFAAMFNAPLVPVVCYQDVDAEVEEQFVLEFSAPVFPKERAAGETTQQLYSILEKYVRCYPVQWEGWLYFHNFIDRSNQAQPEIAVTPGDENLPLKFNSDRFALVQHEGKYLVCNFTAHSFSPITDDVYRFLSGLQTPQVIGKNIIADSVVNLLRSGVLTKA